MLTEQEKQEVTERREIANKVMDALEAEGIDFKFWVAGLENGIVRIYLAGKEDFIEVRKGASLWINVMGRDLKKVRRACSALI